MSVVHGRQAPYSMPPTTMGSVKDSQVPMEHVALATLHHSTQSKSVEVPTVTGTQPKPAAKSFEVVHASPCWPAPEPAQSAYHSMSPAASWKRSHFVDGS